MRREMAPENQCSSGGCPGLVKGHGSQGHRGGPHILETGGPDFPGKGRPAGKLLDRPVQIGMALRFAVSQPAIAGRIRAEDKRSRPAGKPGVGAGKTRGRTGCLLGSSTRRISVERKGPVGHVTQSKGRSLRRRTSASSCEGQGEPVPDQETRVRIGSRTGRQALLFPRLGEHRFAEVHPCDLRFCGEPGAVRANATSPLPVARSSRSRGALQGHGSHQPSAPAVIQAKAQQMIRQIIAARVPSETSNEWPLILGRS